ncbi:hypothetical protein CK203_115688 [Vitis vinifera]|uniref:Uncharacterized protein n=1 Tax=Vitis vinifera TaxID=29760 RepID=A0A438C973_VITVI|nr:hypothetical protein CK203_115688 [Vitis vinifera]
MEPRGPKQLDGVMCGYFVIRDIIANRSLLTSQVYLPMYFHKYMVTFVVVAILRLQDHIVMHRC